MSRETDRDLLKSLVGKTVAEMNYDEHDNDERLTITFTDGTVLGVYSWDYEGYSSGLTILEETPSTESEESQNR